MAESQINRLELEGVIKEKWDGSTEKVEKKEFVLSWMENGYSRETHFQMLGQRASIVDKCNIGDKVKVIFNPESRESKTTPRTYFTSCIAWMIKPVITR